MAKVAVDSKLVEEARRCGGHKTKKEAAVRAFEANIRHHKQMRILEAFGTIDFDPAYDYRAECGKKRFVGRIFVPGSRRGV
jgi:hypothetical protein